MKAFSDRIFVLKLKNKKMLSNIPWSEFLWFLSLLLICYYLYVCIFYFGKDLSTLFRLNKNKDSLFVEPSASHDQTKVSNSEIPCTLVHELLEDLKKIFIHSAQTETMKPELIQAIQSKMKGYPNISETDLKEDISEHIVQEVKQICGIDLETGDLHQIWAL
jgi:hypothetical protein